VARAAVPAEFGKVSQTNEALFQHAVTNVLQSEGGYVNHPADPGGATNLGVTQRTFDGWRDSKGRPREDVRLLTRDEAVEIYRERYWNPLPQGLADDLRYMAFDSAVNHGLSRATGWLGTHTSLTPYTANRLRFYASLSTWPDFGRGWTRRVAHVQEGITEWLAQSAPSGERRAVEVTVLHDFTLSDAARLLVARARGERSVVFGPSAVTATVRKLDVRRLLSP
jgi:lysozyme family protein